MLRQISHFLFNIHVLYSSTFLIYDHSIEKKLGYSNPLDGNLSSGNPGEENMWLFREAVRL